MPTVPQIASVRHQPRRGHPNATSLPNGGQENDCSFPRTGRLPTTLSSAHLNDIEADDDTVMNRIRALISVDGAVGLVGVKAGGHNIT